MELTVSEPKTDTIPFVRIPVATAFEYIFGGGTKMRCYKLGGWQFIYLCNSDVSVQNWNELNKDGLTRTITRIFSKMELS